MSVTAMLQPVETLAFFFDTDNSGAATNQVRFARGTARKSRWCAVEHRVIDWGIPLLNNEEFEVVIMIVVATEEMHGSD
jgi:hypothetical protein